jgi:hypothetical protein
MQKYEKQRLLVRLRSDAAIIAQHFGLKYKAIESERANVKRRYGACYTDGLIRIRLWHVRTKRPLSYSSLIDTLCHELAHLRHFDHGTDFQRLYQQILRYARNAGIYRPSTDRATLAHVTRSPTSKRRHPVTTLSAATPSPRSRPARTTAARARGEPARVAPTQTTPAPPRTAENWPDLPFSPAESQPLAGELPWERWARLLNIDQGTAAAPQRGRRRRRKPDGPGFAGGGKAPERSEAPAQPPKQLSLF